MSKAPYRIQDLVDRFDSIYFTEDISPSEPQNPILPNIQCSMSKKVRKTSGVQDLVHKKNSNSLTTTTLFAAFSQQCFSFTPNQHQPAATSQPAVLFSHNKSASATSHSTANRVNKQIHLVGIGIPRNQGITILSKALFSTIGKQ